MTVENRIISLQKKHDELEKKITALENSPSADSLEIRELKKEKLAVKEEWNKLVSA